jgi:ATP-dependent DNA ligase
MNGGQRHQADNDKRHEVKHGGYRLLVKIYTVMVRIYTRRRMDWTKRVFPHCRAALRINAKSLDL